MSNTFIHGARRYRVTAPMIVAFLVGGGRAQLEEGAILPAATKLSHIDHLLEQGLVEQIEVSA